MALRSIQHAADPVEIAAVITAVKVVVTAPALIVATNGFERATAQYGAAMMAYQRWLSGVVQLTAGCQRDLQAEEIALGDDANNPPLIIDDR